MAGAVAGAVTSAQGTAEWPEERISNDAMQMGFVCSISLEIMQNPAVASDGNSYEKTSISNWLAHNDTSPLTGLPLVHKNLTPNNALKSSIETWLELQHGEARAEKRRKIGADEMKKFLKRLPELLRTHNIADIVNGLLLDDNLELHTRVLDALCRYSYGGKENCARIVAGGGLGASVATMKVHMLPSHNGWRVPCLDACTILQMVLLDHGGMGRQAILAAIHNAGGVLAITDLAKARYVDSEMVMRVMSVLCEFLNVVSVPIAFHVADMVVAGVVQPIVDAMELHSDNVYLLTCACRTLGELARDVQGRKTEDNVANILAGGGVFAVVQSVEDNMSGGDKMCRHKFLLVACSALNLFMLDDAVCQSSEAEHVIKCLCGVIRKYPTQDGVMDAAVPALLKAARVCVGKMDLACKGLGGLCGVMLGLNKNLVRKQSVVVSVTIANVMRLLETLPMSEIGAATEGHIRTVVGVMKQHENVHDMQVSAVVFLKKCMSIPGMDAVITEAGGIEALVESVRRHTYQRLGTRVWPMLGLLLNASTDEGREQRVVMAIAAGGMEVLLGVLARQGHGDGHLPRFVHSALLVLPKLCVSDANYQKLVELRGLEEIARTISLYTHEADAVVCMNVLQRIYCRASVEYTGLNFCDIEVVVRAMDRHGGNGLLQKDALDIVGMYLRCLRIKTGGMCRGRVVPDVAGGAMADSCLRAMLASMQRKAEDVLVLEAGFTSLLRFLALRESRGELLVGIGAVFSGGGGDMALGTLNTHKSSSKNAGMRGRAFTVLAVMCICSANRIYLALDGAVQHALESLRSDACGETEAWHALAFLARLAHGNEEITAEIVVRGGIAAVLGSLVKGAAEGTGARDLAEKACEVLLALTGNEVHCEEFAMQGGIGAVVQVMKAHANDASLHKLVTLLCRVSLIDDLIKCVATAGGIKAVIGFVGMGTGLMDGRLLHYFTSRLLHNLAKQDSLHVLLKEDALGWIEAVLERGVGVSEPARGRYTEVAATLRGVPEVGVVCPYCGESASSLAAFERHMGWYCMSRFVVTVSFWKYGSHLESSVKVDDLVKPLLGQVMAKLKSSEARWGTLPAEGVRVYLGDETRFALTELDSSVSLRRIRAQGGVHVSEGVVRALAGSMRLHIFDCSDDCRAKECAGSVFMQRKAGGVW